jgi:hypothetical protein
MFLQKCVSIQISQQKYGSVLKPTRIHNTGLNSTQYSFLFSSYFDHGKLGAWAGPKHWKFKPLGRVLPEGEKGTKGKKKKVSP